MKHIRFRFSRVATACLTPLLLFSASIFAETPSTESTPSAAESAATTDETRPINRVNIDEVRRFVSVFRAVKEGYVDTIDDETLMRAAIRGLLTDLDPHSAYLNAEESQAFNEAANGAYEGLGIEVVQQPDRSLMVISPIDDTPAARAGILAGDIIIAIDGQSITANGVDAAIDTMRGEVGSSTKLTILREGQRDPLEFTLIRETIRVSSVRTRLLEPGYGYLRISTFQTNTGMDVESKLKETIRKNGKPLKGLVIDLRNNPGGLLNAAIEAADAFLDDGIIVSTRGRLEHSQSEARAHQGDLMNGAPIAILVNSGTASAAEVLAGALRDHHRALVLGTTTFGKGSVQTVLPLDNGDAIKVTTARYYTPNGTSIQASGIVPDVILDRPAEPISSSAKSPPKPVRERDLPGHLRGDNEPLEKAAPSEGAIQLPPITRSEELEDGDIREALNLLKGLSLFRDKAVKSGSSPNTSAK